MKAYLILINWILSFCGLCIDAENSPLWAVLIMAAWFVASCFLLRWADKRGWMKNIVERFKLDEND
jgi:hypothetical protein